MKMIICKNCNKVVPANPKIKNQHYCNNSECQKARKAEWQRERMKSDPDYKNKQKESNKKWKEKNPDYWKDYRKKNADKVEKNRRQQNKRNIEKRGREKKDKMDLSFKGAKIDPSEIKKIKLVIDFPSVIDCKDGRVNSENYLIDVEFSGSYEIVKMDASKKSVHIISGT